MAGPQTAIPLAATVLGTIGTICWCIQLIPQIWRNWRVKNTDGLPGLMVMMWAAAAVPFGVYSIVQNFNIPLQVQPQCFGLLSLVCWGQTLIYHNGWRVWTAALLTGLLVITFGSLETLFILTLRGPYAKGVSWPLTMMAIIASVILGLGLIPPYFELAKRKGRVIGIDFIFLTVDWCGAFFSLMALVAQNTFDYLGGTLYIICLLLEIGIFASQIIWLYRTRNSRRLAKKSGKSYDEYMAEISSPIDPNQLPTGSTAPKFDAHLSVSPYCMHQSPGQQGGYAIKGQQGSIDVVRHERVDIEMGMLVAARAKETDD